MANDEQLAILKSGAVAWNAWEGEHADERIDLSQADLSGAYLSRAVLFKAALGGANLSGADLRWADLRRADLSGAYLSGAYLTLADLSEADLSGAILGRANLTGANLTGAYLSAAFLRDALLSGAHFSGTAFIDTDLTGAKGLDSCHHSGPSTIDHRTLAWSGPLPIPFLRGVGLPDRLIEYLPSLLGEAIQFYACFISYSSRDQSFAERLHADLQNKGVRCWYAPEDIQGGKKIHEQIDEAIRLHDKLCYSS